MVDSITGAQKFHKGDHVRISEDAGWEAREGIVVGSYTDQYGGPGHLLGSGERYHTYTLDIAESGQCSWFDERYLTLIESSRLDLLESWEATRKMLATERGNLDWVFLHGDDVLEHKHGASIHALAACLEITVDMLWGAAGEGCTYYERSMTVLHMAAKYLQHGDKAGWLAFCEQRMKEAKEATA